MSFVDKILPGNYWITKSMEFVKVQSSGTLWHLKKWIVFYYYVFLRDELFDSDYKEIESIFNDFISSLPLDLQESAESFFYDIDFREKGFVKMSTFINVDANSFSNISEKRKYIIKAKRFYFMYLMNSGGQSGWKKEIKNKIFSGKNYNDVINEIVNEMRKAGLSQAKIDGQLSDFPATIRNERQIFFYYGFFHGKDSADLSGFYNLTNVGKAILTSNFHELLLIWEHQKIKMISQSPVTEIKNIQHQNLQYDKFDILNHPYIELLRILKNNSSVSIDEYQYLISKITNSNTINISEINNNELLDGLKTKARSFCRKSELEPEDFLKELKKFILGICSLPKDYGLNYLSFLSWVKENEVKVIDQKKAEFTVENYGRISHYLDSKYGDLYNRFSKELKNKYSNIIEKSRFMEDDEVIYEWYKYIINFNESLYLNLIYLGICNRESIYNYSIDSTKISSYYEDYKNVLKLFGVNKSQFKKYVSKIQDFLLESDDFIYEDIQDEYETYVEPRMYEQTVSEEKLKEISVVDSNENRAVVGMNRKRNPLLISALRTYYNKNFSDPQSKLIKCDCCGEKTFITTNNYAYLEFHHLIPFSTDFGPDHYLNLFGICPSCHRKMHFLNHDEKPELYLKLSNNNNFGKTLIKRINFLFENGILEPIHLDFLKKEKIITKQQYDNLLNNLTIGI